MIIYEILIEKEYSVYQTNSNELLVKIIIDKNVIEIYDKHYGIYSISNVIKDKDDYNEIIKIINGYTIEEIEGYYKDNKGNLIIQLNPYNIEELEELINKYYMQ